MNMAFLLRHTSRRSSPTSACSHSSQHCRNEPESSRSWHTHIVKWTLGASLALCSQVAVLAQTLRLAHDQNFPPFVEAVSGPSRGLAVDLIQAAAQRAGLAVQFVPVPFEQLNQTLVEGRADAIFPVAINSQRRDTLDFSQPLLMSGGALFVRAPAPTPHDLSWLDGKVVVTPKTGPLAAYLATHAPKARLIVTADYTESLEKLMQGEADAAALNLQVGSMLAAQQYPNKITPATHLFLELPLALATAKGNGELLKPLDAAMEQLRLDGSRQKILNRWSPP